MNTEKRIKERVKIMPDIATKVNKEEIRAKKGIRKSAVIEKIKKEGNGEGQDTGENKTRYSDAELQEFKQLILAKLEDSKKEAQSLQDIMRKTYDNGTDDTARTFKNLEESSDTLAKEELGQLVNRQQKFIEQLEGALVRIETKTYGICHLSGKLIPKERLRIVPHTTQTIEAKLSQERQ